MSEQVGYVNLVLVTLCVEEGIYETVVVVSQGVLVVEQGGLQLNNNKTTKPECTWVMAGHEARTLWLGKG